MSEHRPGINPGYLAKHSLNVSGLNDSNASAIVAELDALPCMDAVELYKEKRLLKIAYDASHNSIDEMIKIIQKYGVAVEDSWWSRTKLGWQRQIDQNIQDNAKHKPHCCNKAPHQ